jgi:hypothetical protein
MRGVKRLFDLTRYRGTVRHAVPVVPISAQQANGSLIGD